jgi:hypothetical protein
MGHFQLYTRRHSAADQGNRPIEPVAGPLRSNSTMPRLVDGSCSNLKLEIFAFSIFEQFFILPLVRESLVVWDNYGHLAERATTKTIAFGGRQPDTTFLCTIQPSNQSRRNL